MRRVDGRITHYRLLIDATTARVRVREKEPELLPAWCPELHINEGGYFCLGYGADAPDPVTSPKTADNWWFIVNSFLRLQERARGLRRWPNGNAWAHGGAAGYQAIAEEAANFLSAGLWAALREGRIRAHRHNKRSLRVTQSVGRLYTVRTGDKFQIVNVRQACLCGSGVAMKKCSDHAGHAVTLALALAGMEQALGAFWEIFKDRPCCGKTTSCPLQFREAAKAA
ncbi:MAG TPA: E2 domain-containing protein [Rhizomicrobium sp.]|nr:E2 domain-containing protein [Rhizomicrobium sp.]